MSPRNEVLNILQKKIAESLQDGCPAVRVLAIETLCARDGLLSRNFDYDATYDKGAIESLVEVLGDSNPSVSEAVAQHLPALPESKIHEAFVSCVKDAQPSLRRQIVARYGQQKHFQCLSNAQRLQLLKHLMPVYQRKAWQSKPGIEKPNAEKLKKLEKELDDDRKAIDKMGWNWFKYVSAAQPLDESVDILFRLLVLYAEDILGDADESAADAVVFAVTTVLNGGGLKLVFDDNVLDDLDVCRALVIRAYAGHVKKGEHDQHLHLTAVSKTLESLRNSVDALDQMDDTTVQVFHELMRIIPLLDSDDPLGAGKVASELDKLADEIYQACADVMEIVEPLPRHRVDRLVTIISRLNPLPERTEEEIEEEEERDEGLVPEERAAVQKRRRDARMQSYRSGLSSVDVEEFDRKITLCLVRLIAVLKGIPQTSTLGEHTVLMGTMEEFVKPFLYDSAIHQNYKLRELAWEAHISFVLLSRKTEEIDAIFVYLIRFLKSPATGSEMRRLSIHGFFDFIVERGLKASPEQYNTAMLCLKKLIQDDKPEQDVWLGLYKLIYTDRIPDEHKKWAHEALFEQYFLTTDLLLVPVFGEVNNRIANRSASNKNDIGRKFYDLFKKLYVDKVFGQPRVNATECIKTILQWSDPRAIMDAKEQRDCVGVHTDIIAPDLLKMILYIRNTANHSLERAEATTLKNTLVNCLTDGKIIAWPEKHDAQAMISLWIYVTAVLDHNAVGKKDAKTGSPLKLRKLKETLEKDYEAVGELVGMSDEDQRAQYHETFGDIDDLVPPEVQEEHKKRPKREQTSDTDGNEVPKSEPMDEENQVPPQDDTMKPEPEEDEIPLPRRTSGRRTKKYVRF
ncbi:hypothetical protein CYLTODRAFT_132185 [Cylindrobasidium torrendii FP15055 ss-10]|uniref:Nuclear condensin complex subunit 3 C-terminal domain-containing protein n=1 Tax=Cylindrobasidium torrendii FP15055 ss-10 TaxID=1314674 RepID=A0A0D7AZD4_9AGAR|nr:hypothetical protein CYLTODRAFT_132185 [Cylindrobasidium torrendii FP15055 ss-10]